VGGLRVGRSTFRWLELPGVDPPDEARSKASAFGRLLLAIIAVELCDRAVRLLGEPAAVLHLGLAFVAVGAALLCWRPARAQRAFALCLAAVAVDFAWQFPGSANHHYLQLVCLALLLLLRDDVDPEVRFLTVALRWLLVVGLLYAGLQKLVWGYYFEGEMLAFTIPQNPRFAAVLGLAMPVDEFARLKGLVLQEGAGPFRVDSPLFAVVSNLAYAAELALPLLLLSRRLRIVGVLGTLGYFAAIESAAREVFFGGIMCGLALLYAPASWLRAGLPALLVGLAIVLATSLGLLPFWFFS
jgi:hypothetical protein